MIFPEFDALLDCYPKIIVAHFVPELIPLQSSFNALQNMSTGKAYGPNKKTNKPREGKEGSRSSKIQFGCIIRPSAAANLERFQYIDGHGGDTVLSAQNPTASILFMISVVNDRYDCRRSGNLHKAKKHTVMLRTGRKKSQRGETSKVRSTRTK